RCSASRRPGPARPGRCTPCRRWRCRPAAPRSVRWSSVDRFRLEVPQVLLDQPQDLVRQTLEPQLVPRIIQDRELPVSPRLAATGLCFGVLLGNGAVTQLVEERPVMVPEVLEARAPAG